MIEESLRDYLEPELKDFIWSTNNRTAGDNTATIYYEGGAKPDIYEAEMRYPIYMVYIRSSDFTKVANAAQRVYDLLHLKSFGKLSIPLYANDTEDYPSSHLDVDVFLIEAMSDPIRVGVEDNVMEYSINVQCTLRKL